MGDANEVALAAFARESRVADLDDLRAVVERAADDLRAAREARVVAQERDELRGWTRALREGLASGWHLWQVEEHVGKLPAEGGERG